MGFTRAFLLCGVVFFSVAFKTSFATKCEMNKKKYLVSIIDQSVLTCPPLFGDDDDKYCCSRSDGRMYCCDASEFIEENGIGFIFPVLVSVVVALLITCCVCCLCCPCCLWFKRRNRGTVYNNVPVTVAPPVPQHGPHSDVYQQQPPPYPVMMQPVAYPPVPPHGMPMVQQYPPHDAYSAYPPAVPPHGMQPPPYNEAANNAAAAAAAGNQMYSRQSPYNPNF